MTANDTPLRLKTGLAEMLKGGVIMDVTTVGQARIAEDSGACAVMALERVPSDIRKDGGVARMARIDIIEAIMGEVSIPVMAKSRIGHFYEAKLLEVCHRPTVPYFPYSSPYSWTHLLAAARLPRRVAAAACASVGRRFSFPAISRAPASWLCPADRPRTHPGSIRRDLETLRFAA